MEKDSRSWDRGSCGMLGFGDIWVEGKMVVEWGYHPGDGGWRGRWRRLLQCGDSDWRLSLVEDFFLVTLLLEGFSILLQPPVISLRWWFDSQFSPRIFLHKFGAELTHTSSAALGSSTTCVGRHLTSLVWGSIRS